MLSLSKALQWIFLSTLVISGLPAIGLGYVRYLNYQRSHDPKYKIVAIVQTCSQKEALKTRYFAEVLDLSIDKPKNIYAFNEKEGELKLLFNPLIKRARIQKINPGMLYIDYDLRIPVAYLGEFTNTAIDEEGVVFALKPYLTPKKLPEIILGFADLEISAPSFGKNLADPKVDLAMELLNICQTACCPDKTFIKRIDVSKAFQPSYGQREVVVIIERHMEVNGILYQFPRILRLHSEKYHEALANYLTLSEHLVYEEVSLGKLKSEITEHEPVIIDLRIPHLAFIKR